MRSVVARKTRTLRLSRVGMAALLAVVVGAAPAVASAPSPATLPFDLLAVLKVAYYPAQVMAYCFKEVQASAKYQTVSNAWLKRNQPLLDKVEVLAKQNNISNALRVQSDKDTLDAITKTVASQPDKPAYCGLIASVIDGGQFDLTIRDDLKQPLKRIFPQ
jgi:hypothetical protein